MRFGVLIFPGSNCAEDAFYVLSSILKKETKYIWHKDTNDLNVDAVIIPGGFTYGDYLRCGAIARFSPVMSKVYEFVEKGGIVLGICNGFQILTEAGLLPGSLLKNKSLKFICSNQNLKVTNSNSVFTNKLKTGDVIHCPLAHNEGNYYVDEKTLVTLKNKNQILFQYSDESGNINEKTNPNGSVFNIAGVMNEKGNVLGMMPHPERTSDSILGCSDGIKIFESIINFKF